MRSIIFLFSLVVVASLFPSYSTQASGLAWSQAQLLEHDDIGNATDPHIDMNINGKAVAVWQQSDGTRDNMWANTYDGNTWGTAQLIETNNAGNVGYADVAINDNGEAIAVWHQFDGTRNNVWANTYNGNTWGTAQLIETNNAGNAFEPKVAIDSSGRALVLWNQIENGKINIWVNRYAGNAWSTAQHLVTGNVGNAIIKQVDMDTSGNAIAVGHQSDGTRNNIWATMYTVATNTWGDAQLLENDNVGDAFNAQIDINTSGHAVVAWEQFDGTRYNIWSNTYDGNSWSAPELLEYGGGNAQYVSLDMNDNGDVFVVWEQRDSNLNYDIWSNRFDGNTWGSAERIETNSSVGYYAKIVVDNNRKAIAIWQQADAAGVFNVWSNRFDGNTWGSAQLVDVNNIGNIGAQHIAMDNNGNALAVWHRHDGIRNNIWTSSFTTVVTSTRHSISGTVWEDSNKNTLKENTENIGLKNVEVTLYKDVDNSETYTSLDTLVATAHTDMSGNYVFNNIANGNFIVVVNDASVSLRNDILNGSHTYGLTTLKSMFVPLQNSDVSNTNFGFAIAKVRLSVDKTTISEAPTVGNTTFVTVKLSVPTAFETGVMFVYGGTATSFTPVATAGVDYSKQDSIGIPAGSTTASFAIKAIHDMLPEYPERFDVEILSVTNADKDDIVKSTITIFDDNCTLDVGVYSYAPRLNCGTNSVISTRSSSKSYSPLPPKRQETKQICRYVKDVKTRKLVYVCK